MARIVLVDDDAAIRTTLELHLSARGFDVALAANVEAGLGRIVETGADVVISDIRMAGRDGLSLLEDVTRRWPGLPVIMITAFHDLDTTVAAIERGAMDYITKPIDLDELDAAVERVLMRRAIGLNGALEIDEADEPPRMIGHSRAMTEVFKTIARVAQSRITVLVTGPSGAGKEMVARAIHDVSRHRDKPYLAINCAALVDDLIENELFGHEKGAFTGAGATQKGKVELVGEGTLFLDEIGELSMRVQSKLLRLIEQREYIPVGGSRALTSRCRFVAATNADLEEQVRRGLFRADLYHRLHVAAIRLPALAQRREDIPLLVRHLLKRVNRSLDRRIRFVTASALARLAAHDWPGNIRELENVLIRAAIEEPGDTISSVCLPGDGCGPVIHPAEEAGPAGREEGRSLRDRERDHIEKVLASTGWRKGRACDILGISRPTLERRIREFGLAEARGDRERGLNASFNPDRGD